MNHILLQQTFDKMRHCRKHPCNVRAGLCAASHCQRRGPCVLQQQLLWFHKVEKKETDDHIQVIQILVFRVLDKLS